MALVNRTGERRKGKEMIGDKLVITEYHRENGRKVAEAVTEKIQNTSRVYTITVAGESGSGKSETAATTAEELEKQDLKVLILGQDDYFILPPKSNAAKRNEGIDWVGSTEVKLDLMNEHLRAAKTGEKEITKPLVYFEDDRVDEEKVSLEGVNVVIAEGTYTTMLEDADFHAFINATYHHTLEHRKKRARDETQGAFIEQVLEIEHKIISANKAKAHLMLPPSN
jgi:uridine kinase